MLCNVVAGVSLKSNSNNITSSSEFIVTITFGVPVLGFNTSHLEVTSVGGCVCACVCVCVCVYVCVCECDCVYVSVN